MYTGYILFFHLWHNITFERFYLFGKKERATRRELHANSDTLDVKNSAGAVTCALFISRAFYVFYFWKLHACRCLSRITFQRVFRICILRLIIFNRWVTLLLSSRPITQNLPTIYTRAFLSPPIIPVIVTVWDSWNSRYTGNGGSWFCLRWTSRLFMLTRNGKFARIIGVRTNAPRISRVTAARTAAPNVTDNPIACLQVQ